MRVALLKWLILRWLGDSPLSGYEILKKCEHKFGRASPGSVYPALRQLAEKGLIRKEQGKYTLTDRGRAILDKLEREREAHVQKARQALLALSELFDDPTLKHVADTLPDWSRFSPKLIEAIIDLRNEVVRLGDAALPVIKKAVKELRSLSRGSSRT